MLAGAQKAMKETESTVSVRARRCQWAGRGKRQAKESHQKLWLLWAKRRRDVIGERHMSSEKKREVV